MNLLYTLALTAVATGAALLDTRTCPLKVILYKDTFDSANGLTTIDPTISPIGNTAGGALYYNAYNYLKPSISALLTPPPSPPNVAGTASITQALRGAPYFSPINTTVSSFQLVSLCYICVTNTLVGTVNPVGCTLQLNGQTTGGNVNTQPLPFKPDTLQVPTKYACASFPASRFSSLKNATLQLLKSDLPKAAVVVAMDNVTYYASHQEC